MFGDDIAAYLPEHVKPFAAQLKQFPIGYEKWIYATSDPPETYQGDVFTDIPFVWIDDNGDHMRAECPGMVVSNTCDAQPNQGDFVLVAQVVDLKTYRDNSDLHGEELENHIRALTENKISRLMFLPEGTGISNSFVDFGKLCSVSLAYFHFQVGQKRITSLSQCGHYFLLFKLAYHFSRPEASDAKRRP